MNENELKCKLNIWKSVLKNSCAVLNSRLLKQVYT